jgi:hypothetical protein
MYQVKSVITDALDVRYHMKLKHEIYRSKSINIVQMTGQTQGEMKS